MLTIAVANEVPLLIANPPDEGPLAQTMLSPGAHTRDAGSVAPCEKRAKVPSVVTAPATISGKSPSRPHIAGTVSSAGLREAPLPAAVTTTTFWAKSSWMSSRTNCQFVGSAELGPNVWVDVAG